MIRATFAARGISGSSRAFWVSSSVRLCLRTSAEIGIGDFCVADYLAECDEVYLILYTSSRFTVAVCLVAFPALLLLRLLILPRSGRFVLLVSKLSNHIRAQPAARPPWRLICGGLRDSWTHSTSLRAGFTSHAKRAFPFHQRQNGKGAIWLVVDVSS
jgi:hypothetical protein